jgi:hypothetical protein
MYYRYLTLEDKDKLIESALKTVDTCNHDIEISLFYTQTTIAIAAIVKQLAEWILEAYTSESPSERTVRSAQILNQLIRRLRVAFVPGLGADRQSIPAMPAVDMTTPARGSNAVHSTESSRWPSIALGQTPASSSLTNDSSYAYFSPD